MAQILLLSVLAVSVGQEVAAIDIFNCTTSADTVYSYAPDTEMENEFDCGFPWAVRNESDSCKCGSSIHERVFCIFNETDKTSSKVGILDCSCMTYDEKRNETVVGYCVYNCVNGTRSKKINRVYQPVNNHTLHIVPSNFTDRVCNHLNRTGRLCGECTKDHYPPVYSYTFECIRCDSRWYNWLLFIVVAFVPLTIFLVFVLIFRVRATSAQLSAFVLFSQNVSIPINVQIILSATSGTQLTHGLAKTIVTLYSIWNLDFFRSIFPPICIPITTMQVVLLEYTIAFYPLLVLVLVYFAAKCQMNRVQGILCLWAPMHKTMNHLQQGWKLQRSIIDAFATFFLLSYNKLLSTSFNMLIFVRVYNAHGTRVGSYVYNDASLEYFGPDHWYYGLLAGVILIIFVVLPVVILLLYPMRWFHKCLSQLNMNGELIRAFMDSFQGCYKDGTSGTRDCRYFAGVYFLLRIVMFIACSVTLTSLFYSVATIIFISMGMLIIIVRPYKEHYKIYNKVDAIIVLIQALVTASILCHIFATIKGERFKTFSVVLAATFYILPLIYITVVALHWLHTRNSLNVLWTQFKVKFKDKCFSSREEQQELLHSSHQKYGTNS